MHTLPWHHFLGYVRLYSSNPAHFYLCAVSLGIALFCIIFDLFCASPHPLQYSSDGGHEAVEDLLLLLSLAFEDYALSLEPGTEPTQGAVAFLVAMVAGLPVTMLRLTALIGPENATLMNHTGSGLATAVHRDMEH